MNKHIIEYKPLHFETNKDMPERRLFRNGVLVDVPDVDKDGEAAAFPKELVVVPTVLDEKSEGDLDIRKIIFKFFKTNNENRRSAPLGLEG